MSSGLVSAADVSEADGFTVTFAASVAAVFTEASVLGLVLLSEPLPNAAPIMPITTNAAMVIKQPLPFYFFRQFGQTFASNGISVLQCLQIFVVGFSFPILISPFSIVLFIKKP